MTEPDPPAGNEFPQYGPPPGAPPPYVPPAFVGRTGTEPFDPIGAFTWGWRQFTQHLGPVFIGVAIFIGFRAAFAAAGFTLGFGSEIGKDVVFASTGSATAFEAFSVASTSISLVLTLIEFVVTFILTAAAIRASLDVADGRVYDFINALKRIPFGRVIGANLLVGLIIVAGLGVSALPGTALLFSGLPEWIGVVAIALVALPVTAGLSALLYFTVYVVIDQPETGVTDAVRVSAGLIRANLGDAFLMGLLGALVMITGFLACCVGLVVAYPISIFAAAYTYRAFNGQPVAG